MNTFRVIIEPDEKGTFHAFAPALPGCHTFGRTLAQTREHMRDAMSVYVRSLMADGLPVPKDQSMDTLETIFTPVRVRRVGKTARKPSRGTRMYV